MAVTFPFCSIITYAVDVLNSVSGNLMAAGRAVPHKLLNFEGGRTAMKHLHINKKSSLA